MECHSPLCQGQLPPLRFTHFHERLNMFPNSQPRIDLRQLALVTSLDGISIPRDSQHRVRDVVDDPSVTGIKSVVLYIRKKNEIPFFYRYPPHRAQQKTPCGICEAVFPAFHDVGCHAPEDRKQSARDTRGVFPNVLMWTYATPTQSGKIAKSNISVYANGLIVIGKTSIEAHGSLQETTTVLHRFIEDQINQADKKSKGKVLLPEYRQEFGNTFKIIPRFSILSSLHADTYILNNPDEKCGVRLDGMYNVFYQHLRSNGGEESISFPDGHVYLLSHSLTPPSSTLEQRGPPQFHFQLVTTSQKDSQKGVRANKIWVQFGKQGRVQIVGSVCRHQDTIDVHKTCPMAGTLSIREKDIRVPCESIWRLLGQTCEEWLTIPIVVPAPHQLHNAKTGFYGKALKSKGRKELGQVPDPVWFHGHDIPDKGLVIPKCHPDVHPHPGGKKRKDGLWEPACYKHKDKARWNIWMRKGFPYKEDAKKYNIGATDEEDATRTITGESRRFDGLEHVSASELIEILEFVHSSPQSTTQSTPQSPPVDLLAIPMQVDTSASSAVRSKQRHTFYLFTRQGQPVSSTFYSLPDKIQVGKRDIKNIPRVLPGGALVRFNIEKGMHRKQPFNLIPHGPISASTPQTQPTTIMHWIQQNV